MHVLPWACGQGCGLGRGQGRGQGSGPGPRPGREDCVTRLLIAIVIGAALAVGGSLLTASYLAGATSNTPANAPLYNYGTG